MNEAEMQKARDEGFVCKDCNEPIPEKDREAWARIGKRCRECYFQVNDINDAEKEQEYLGPREE